MALQLWLMRHGIAEDPDYAGSDAGRALTDLGRQQVAAAAAWLGERVAVPQVIWHSPLLRTEQTAHTVAETLRIPISPQAKTVLAPGMTADRLLAAVGASGAEVILCVGHQPDIGAAIQDCIGGGRFGVAPGTIASITFGSQVVSGAGMLRWYVDPDWFG